MLKNISWLWEYFYLLITILSVYLLHLKNTIRKQFKGKKKGTSKHLSYTNWNQNNWHYKRCNNHSIFFQLWNKFKGDMTSWSLTSVHRTLLFILVRFRIIPRTAKILLLFKASVWNDVLVQKGGPYILHHQIRELVSHPWHHSETRSLPLIKNLTSG